MTARVLAGEPVHGLYLKKTSCHKHVKYYCLPCVVGVLGGPALNRRKRGTVERTQRPMEFDNFMTARFLKWVSVHGRPLQKTELS